MEDLTLQLQSLQNQIADLTAQVYKNNFSNTQVFNKAAIFGYRLKVPHYSSLPTVCEVGDIIESGGKLYICTVENTTWTVVGSQS